LIEVKFTTKPLRAQRNPKQFLKPLQVTPKQKNVNQANHNNPKNPGSDR